MTENNQRIKDLQDAQKAVGGFSTYINELIAEREQLIGTHIPDPVATTKRLATIDAELLAGKGMQKLLTNRAREIKREMAVFERNEEKRKAYAAR